MFFAKQGMYEACGIFTPQHFILIAITLVAIIIGLKCTINKKDVQKIIKRCTIFISICEIIKIIFKIIHDGLDNINSYVPLYYCSMLIYAGILSSFCKGKLKRTGDVFLATGGIIGGITFIILPTTSLTYYPMWHFLSIHSFIFHGIMVYLSLLVNITHYIELEKQDIVYYSTFVGIICIIAYIVNNIYGSNLMFISENFPGMPIEIIYNSTGPFFTIIMMLAQMFIPFYIIYGLKILKERRNNK